MKGFLFLISILVLGVGAPAYAAPPVCNPTTEGTIVYNVDYKVMQYCDGTNWISMRGSAVTTFDSLSCADGETVEWDSATSKWSCAIDDEGVTTESDPTVPTNLKDGVAWGEVSGIPAGFADGTDDGITSESDPQVNATTSGKWCRGTGSQVTCDQDAPPTGGNVPAGTLCGIATRNGQSPCGSGSGYSSIVPCNGTNVRSSCPSGYTLRSITTSVDLGGLGNNNSYRCQRTCSKN